MNKFSMSDRRLKNLNEAAAEFTAVCGSEHYTNAIRSTLRQLVHRTQSWDGPLLLDDLHRRNNSSIYDIGLKRYDFLVWIGHSFESDSRFHHYVDQLLEVLALEQFQVLRGKLMAAEVAA